MRAMTVVTAHTSYIYFVKHGAYDIRLHNARMAESILHGIDFRGAPFNDKDIRIYES